MALIKKSRENTNYKNQSLVTHFKTFLKNYVYKFNLHISVNFKPCFKLFFPNCSNTPNRTTCTFQSKIFIKL